MSERIPYSARAEIKRFLAEEAKEKDQPNPQKRIRQLRKEIQEIESCFRRQWKPRALMQLVVRMGWVRVDDNGHFKYKKPEDSTVIVVIPRRGSSEETLALNTTRNTLNTVLLPRLKELREELDTLQTQLNKS